MIKALRILTLTSFFLGGAAFAKDPELSYYIFQNKGKALFGTIILDKDENVIEVPAEWFTWKCSALKQYDGVLMDCRRKQNQQDEFVETKVYCDLPQNKFGRLMRLGNGPNFVTFEARCSSKIISNKKPKPESSSTAGKIAQPTPPTPPTPPVMPESSIVTPDAPKAPGYDQPVAPIATPEPSAAPAPEPAATPPDSK